MSIQLRYLIISKLGQFLCPVLSIVSQLRNTVAQYRAECEGKCEPACWIFYHALCLIVSDYNVLLYSSINLFCNCRTDGEKKYGQWLIGSLKEEVKAVRETLPSKR